jgi:hypothetical protein
MGSSIQKHMPTSFEKGGSMEDKNYFLEAVGKDIEEDDFNDGVDPSTRQQNLYDSINKQFGTINELCEYLSKTYGLSEDIKKYTAFDDGRLTYSRTENDNGDEPSKSEMNRWKTGKLKLWAASFDIYVSYSTITPVPVADLASLGAEQYAAGGQPKGSTIANHADASFGKGDRLVGPAIAQSADAFKSGGKADAVARIPNTEAKFFVENLMPFKGSNLEGKHTDNGDYVVLSFGCYPIWYYCTKNKKWYGNADKYCQATAIHISQSRPHYDVEMLPMKEFLEAIRTDESRYDFGGSVGDLMK